MSDWQKGHKNGLKFLIFFRRVPKFCLGKASTGAAALKLVFSPLYIHYLHGEKGEGLSKLDVVHR